MTAVGVIPAPANLSKSNDWRPDMPNSSAFFAFRVSPSLYL